MSDLDDDEIKETRKYYTSNASNLKEYETLNILSDDIVGYAVGHERYEEAVKDLVQMYRELKEKYSVAKTTEEEALILESELRKENENLKERNQYLEESDWAWHELLKMQNKREYRSKFLKEFQKEYGKNVLPDYDEIYKRYDKQKNIIKNSISKDKIKEFKNLLLKELDRDFVTEDYRKLISCYFDNLLKEN